MFSYSFVVLKERTRKSFGFDISQGKVRGKNISLHRLGGKSGNNENHGEPAPTRQAEPDISRIKTAFPPGVRVCGQCGSSRTSGGVFCNPPEQ